jgi:hypothetical protein
MAHVSDHRLSPQEIISHEVRTRQIRRLMSASLRARLHQPVLVLDVARVRRLSDEHQKVFSL